MRRKKKAGQRLRLLGFSAKRAKACEGLSLGHDCRGSSDVREGEPIRFSPAYDYPRSAAGGSCSGSSIATDTRRCIPSSDARARVPHVTWRWPVERLDWRTNYDESIIKQQ
jgi:hypothetical protein